MVELQEVFAVSTSEIVEEDKKLLTITEKGFGKKSEFSEFEPRNRGILGVIVHNITDKTGKLASVSCVDENKDVMVITNEGTIIRTATDVIPTYRRSTTGVKVMRIDEDAIVANTTLVDKEEEIDEEENNIELNDEKEIKASENQENEVKEEAQE